ncbi:hypothetical protein C1280_18630 [Gemmata obscuriglobus]|uniref:Insertion element IS402-like domain-containing protein n=1 Tax=Gemmata obscuriglobus TaxID=114 RepID=A0A2Z3H550_9BACT|nr:hypothetical protein C1280_18630 [Gemmata obscuriglobus]
MDRVYPTDWTDAQWAVIEPLIPPAKPGGRPRTVDMRLVVNTIFYLAKAGCQWAMLPRDLAKRSTANEYLMAWVADGTWQRILDTFVRRSAWRPVGIPTRRRRRSTRRRSKGPRRVGHGVTTAARRSTAGSVI